MTFRSRAALLIAITAFALRTSACSNDSELNRTTAACRRIATASCSKFVECQVLEGGRLLTNADCEQIQSNMLFDCANNHPVEHASDAEISACVRAYQKLPCDEICGQIPQNPPACKRPAVLNDAGLVPTTLTDEGAPNLLLGRIVTCGG